VLDRNEQRRLAAILAADVVGYSRLVGLDETGTLRHLKRLRRELIDPAIREHRGRIVKTTGDGILVEFPSAVEAVRCGLIVQRAIGVTERNIPAERRIAFRVGIHQGDIVVENNDLFGDGVNVAARLEGICEAGGVCISGRVYEDTVGRLDLSFEDRGEQQLKNIKRPVRVYALGANAIAALATLADTETKPAGKWGFRFAGPSIRTRLAWAGVLAAVLAAAVTALWTGMDRTHAPQVASLDLSGGTARRGPMLAVLAFANLSGDASQEFFADGISEELITVLSRFEELRVLAHNSTFAYKNKPVEIQELGRKLQAQYVVEGSVRRVADQLNITAQLVDARTGTHVWAQSYERPTASISLLAIQDDIAQRVGAAVGDIRTGAVAKAELERARNKPPAELSSYECIVQGYRASAAQNDAETVLRARGCLEATVKRDPGYAEAWAILTRVLGIQRGWGTGLDENDNGENLVPRIVEAGNRAVQLAPESAAAHFALFSAYQVTCQVDRMRIEADRAVAINPNDANALGLLGNLLAYAGDWDRGLELTKRAIVLAGPATPSWWRWVFAKDDYRKGEYAGALEKFRLAYSESNWLDHLHLIYTLPHLGRVDEARAEIPVLLKLKPGMSVREADRFYKIWCFDADFRDRIVKALRLAGLPES
jgi:adenylate cyclase